jgi:hypothetical protein
LIAELETRVKQLKASEVDMKNLFYREKEAREVLEYDYKQLAYVGDSPEGPLKQPGESCLKPAKNQN